MKRYFTFKRPNKYWEENKVAYWVFDEQGKETTVRTNGTTYSVGHPLKEFAAKEHLIDYPEISPLQADALVEHKWPRWFRYAHSDNLICLDDSQSKCFWADLKGNILHGGCTELKSVLHKLEDWRELSPSEISSLNINNKSTKESEKKNMSKFKVGDKIKSGKYPDWGVMTVKEVDDSSVTAVDNKGIAGVFYYETDKLTPALPTQFQVDTRGLEGVKRELVELAKKYPKYRAGFSSERGCSNYKFLQLNLNGESYQTVTHTEEPYKVDEYPIISLDEAITILTTKPEPKVVEVKLNSTYTAIVTQGKDTVKVGCQEIPVSAVQLLAQTVTEVNK